MATQNLSPNNDKKNGTAAPDSINALAGNDTLTGLAGNDTLNGGIGNDYLDGGTDNDLLIGDAGNDTLLGGAGNDSLDGGADNDKLDGGAGADTLNGGTGFDTMSGGDGNDVYFVDNIGDRVIELAKSTSGKDTVKSSIDYTLPVNVENLELTGLANLKATGNTAANLITGNNGDNLLNGGDGFDTLMGGDGDDTLIGGTGVDQLIGGDGSDTYQISSTEDKIVETARDGDQDVVESSVSYTLGDYLEMLTLTGSKTVNGTGNTLDNTLEGNEADNELNGMAGDDTLIGNGGDDTLTGGAGDDEIDGGEGDDTVNYLGYRDDYSVFLDTDSQTWIVQDINGIDGDGVDEGTDRLSNIETIQFDDGPYIPGLPTLNLADIRLNEGNKGISSAIFVFTLSEPASQTVTIDYATADDTAIAGSDYITARGTVTIPQGQTRQTLTLNVIGDTTQESDETFLLQLSNVDGAVLDTTVATATITNDDQPSLSIKSIDVTEGNSGSSKAVLTVSLSQRASQPVTVQYSTGTGGTATAGVDYTAVTSSLTFNPGETSKTLSIDIKGDTLVEANENFRVQLTSPQNALLDTTAASATVNITNDDRLTLQISSDKQILKAGDTANLTFTFSDIPQDFDASDIQVSGGRIQNVQADTSRKIYTASFVPEANQNRVNGNVSVMTGSYSDAQGTAGVASNVLNFSGDTLAPSLSISSDKTSLKAGDTAMLTFNFSETPNGFDVSDISVSGGILGPLNGTGQTRTALFTPTANTNNLNASIDVAANSYIDSVGNTGSVMNSLSLTGDTQAPSLSISSDKTSLKSGDTATVTFSFSEMPTGFDVSDISVSGGSIVALNGTGLTRMALFTPTANTNNLSASISVNANTYTDAVGNNGLASNSLSLTGDTQAPSLSISSDKTSLKSGDTATVTFSFSEMPMGFDVSNVSVSGGSIGALNGTGLTRTALFTPTANINNLNASISVIPNSYTDTAGNTGIVMNSLNLTGDTQAPSLSIISDKTSLKAGDIAMLTFSFSEIPMGFDVGNIMVNGGTLGILSGNGQTRTAFFTPTANINNLNASISVATNSYTDSAGNSGIVINSLNLTGDTQAPSLSISSDKTSLKAGETTMLTFNFSETPSGFDVSDISVNGGTLGNLNGSGSTRTAFFTPTANINNLNASISVIPNSYTDTAGNSGIVINSLSLSGDTQAPSLNISSDKTSLKAGDTATLTFIFSEMPMGFDVGNVSVSGGSIGALNGTGLTRTAIFTPTANTNNLSASISVNANTYTDAVGNNGLASNSLNLTGDTQAPSLSISSDKTSLKVNDTATLTFSFSEMPTGFDSSKVMVSGGTLGSLNGTGLTRTAIFTPTANTNNLSASISVNANTYTDAVGNNGLASNSLSLAGDTQAPSLSISSDKTSLKVNDTATLTFSFSEMPTGFDSSKIMVSGGTLGSLNGTGLTRTALFTPTANTNNLSASISVNANSYTDAVGNNGLASNSLSLTGDTQAPSLSISSDKTSLKSGDTATVTFSFSEMPTGFEASDISVSGGTLGPLTGTGQTRTALFTPLVNTRQTGSVSVIANSYTDAAGNTGTVNNALSLTLDTVPPTLSITGTTVTEGNSGTSNANVTVSLSAASSQTITVSYATLNGTATAGSDYTAASSSLTFAPGETSKTVSIPIYGDTTVESNETFQVQLSNAANAVLSSVASAATVTITNDDQAVISITGTTVTEGNSGTSNANVTVSLSAASSQTITVNYATLNGTATAGSDYSAASSSLTFAPGETSKTVSIPIYGDTTVESNETFTVNLSSPLNATLSTSSATVTITNDDILITPTLTISADKTSLKAGQTASLSFTFNVVPSGFTASDISVTGGALGGLSVDASGKIYTASLTPTASNAWTGAVNVAASTYTDSTGNAGTASNTLNFNGDTQAPTLTSSTPADNATGVALSSNLVLTFSETVQAGTGNIILSNGTDTRTIGISDTSQVSFSGTGVTINPTADLLGGGNYYLQLASGVIRDAAGNAYAGISDTTTLNVTTQATTSGIQATLTGTSGNDTLNGGTVNDALYGLAGEDLLNGYGGDDWLEGGEGYDTLSGGLGADTLVGGTVTGVDNGYNYLYGGAGNDSLIGSTIWDALYGEDGNDTILGGGGNDDIGGGEGNDSMMGGVGNDSINDPGYGSNWIDAGDGDDTISVGNSGGYPSYSTSDSTTITGGGGRDIYTLYGYGASLVITDFAVGAGGDTLDINTILTSRSTGYTSGNPFGSLGYLRVQQQGADTVLQWDRDGAAGNSATWQTQARLQNLTASSLTGANFAPQAAPDGSEIGVSLTGTTGNDTLNGGAVNDTLYGLAGEDLLNGYGGDDWLEGGQGYDTLSGGLGADTLVGGAVTGVDNGYNYLYGGAGNDSLIGGTIWDALYGEDGNDTILGGGGNDDIGGGEGNDSMMGGVGNDSINDPGYGSNWIDAGDGDDTISVGNSGGYPSYSTSDSTTITGGGGRDIYTLYGYGASLVITDFAVGAGGDTLDINTILTSRSTGYTSGNPFGSLGYLRVQQQGADTVLQWDRDGAAGNSATWQTQARLQNLTASSLTGANFAPQAAPDGSEIGVSLTGTTGNDTLNGGAVNDTLYGLAGEDLLNGYGGDDWLEGGQGYDTLSGGLGADTLVGGAVTGVDNGYNYLYGGAGNDSLIGGTIWDALYGEDGNDTILGGGGNDDIGGGEGNDSMMGGVGNDSINDPGYGSNWIDAGDGDDTISVGNSGGYPSYSTSDSTTITGGGGRDIYTLYGYGASLVITDFAVGAGGDTLDINTILTSRSTGYTSGNPFGSLGYLRVQQQGADTVLQWDRDGAAGNSATWQTQARLQNLTASSLTGANFAPQTPPDGSPATSIGLTGITQTDTNVPLALIG